MNWWERASQERAKRVMINQLMVMIMGPGCGDEIAMGSELSEELDLGGVAGTYKFEGSGEFTVVPFETVRQAIELDDPWGDRESGGGFL